MVKRVARKLDPNDFSLKRDEWEKAVFWSAEKFIVIEYRIARWEYRTLAKALDKAKEIDKARGRRASLVYAANPDGRCIILDGKDWDNWQAIGEARHV